MATRKKKVAPKKKDAPTRQAARPRADSALAGKSSKAASSKAAFSKAALSKAVLSKPSSPKATAGDVDEYMARLEHPLKSALEELRLILRSAAPSITEGVKWNSPSFKTTEYFATANLAPKGGVRLVLHLGAKVRPNSSVEVKDPQGLLTWPAKDRALASFADLQEVRASKSALQAIVRQWIRFV